MDYSKYILYGFLSSLFSITMFSQNDNHSRVLYYEALNLYETKQYDQSLTKINDVKQLAGNEISATVLNLEIKNLIGKRDYLEAQTKLDVLLNSDISIDENVFKDIAGYRQKIQKGIAGFKQFINIQKEYNPEQTLFKFEKNGKLGFYNENLEVVIPFKYDYITEFINGKAGYRILKNKRILRSGIVDQDGNEFEITKEFDSINSIHFNYLRNGILKIYKKNNLTTLIKLNGDTLFPFTKNFFASIIPEIERIIVYTNGNEQERSMVYNFDGKLIFKSKASVRHLGSKYLLSEKNGKGCIVDKNGKILISKVLGSKWPSDFDINSSTKMNNGFNLIRRSKRPDFCYYFNNKGQKISHLYNNARPFINKFAYVEQYTGNKWHRYFVNENFENAFNFKYYPSTKFFSEGIVFIKKGEPYYKNSHSAVNRNGETLFTLNYKYSPSNFFEGLCRIRTDSRNERKKQLYGFINKNGVIVINPKYEILSDFHNGMSYGSIYNEKESNKNVYQVIDKTGNLLKEISSKEMRSIQDDLEYFHEFNRLHKNFF